jgi:hypothetical protein
MFICSRVSCNVVMLFTCTLVRSHPDSKEGVRCETRSIEINSKILGWTWQQDACSEREARRRVSLSLEQGHEGGIREVLQEDGCSSMYKSWLCVLTHIISICSLSMPCNYLQLGNWFTCWLLFIFRRLKINHDSHEFILESGTVANTYSPHTWCWTKSRDIPILFKMAARGFIEQKQEMLSFSSKNGVLMGVNEVWKFSIFPQKNDVTPLDIVWSQERERCSLFPQNIHSLGTLNEDFKCFLSLCHPKWRHHAVLNERKKCTLFSPKMAPHVVWNEGKRCVPYSAQNSGPTYVVLKEPNKCSLFS